MGQNMIKENDVDININNGKQEMDEGKKEINNRDCRIDIYRMMYTYTPKIIQHQKNTCWHCKDIPSENPELYIINIWTFHGEKPQDEISPHEVEECYLCGNNWIMQYTCTIKKMKLIETISSLSETFRLFPGINSTPLLNSVNYIGSFDD